MKSLSRGGGQPGPGWRSLGWGGLLLAAQALAQSAPEPATGFAARPLVHASIQMVVAAHPLAAQAGEQILDAGGSAADAAIATQLVLNLVEPQSSGIGGGAFLLHFDGRRHRLAVYDGRETAPMAATERLFLDADGQPLRFVDALVGGRSVGTPGVVRMLDAVHRRHGRLPWARLFEPAIRIAEEGFAVSVRLNRLLESDRFLRLDADAKALFYHPDGHALAVGEILRNPTLAQVLRRIALEGPVAFYAGPVADAIVDRVRSHPKAPGTLALVDFDRYRVVEREPLCAPFLRYRVCTAPPPSSGGVVLLQLLDVMAHSPALQLPAGHLMAVHAFAEAGSLAFADRDRYLADPAFVSVPTRALLDPGYLAERRELIDPRRSLGIARAGELSQQLVSPPGVTLELPSTTHLSIVDREGNAVSMSSSIESAFGSRTLVKGFLLNNQLTDFSFQPARDGAAVANRVEPGKRPRSTMAPTMVFDETGALRMLLGSPGGPWIAGYVAQALVLRLAQDQPLDRALAWPHWGSRNTGVVDLERGTEAARLAGPLGLLGHEVRLIDMASGTHAIERSGGQWVGAVDPRREGLAIGR